MSYVDPWDVFKYELNMFNGTLALCGHGAHKSYPYPISYAIVESLLLHVRNLCSLVLSRGGESDDITLKKLLPDFSSAKVDELRNLYGNKDEEGKPCWILNKMLAHATCVRPEYYDHAPWLNQLSPVLYSLIAEVKQAREAKG